MVTAGLWIGAYLLFRALIVSPIQRRSWKKRREKRPGTQRRKAREWQSPPPRS
jgi:hypothetical protein